MSADDTAASERGADAETIRVPPPPGGEPELAWSVGDDADEVAADWHGRLMWAGLSVLVVAIAGALILLVSTLFGSGTKNAAGPLPIHSSSVATSVAAAPPLPPAGAPQSGPSVAAASPYASLIGKWSGHHRGLTVSSDGTVELSVPDVPACPQCSAGTMPYATIHIGLTSFEGGSDGSPDGSGKFFGYVKDSSDTRVVPVGVPVEVDVMNASDYSYPGGPAAHEAPGRVVSVSINGDHVGARNDAYVLGDSVPFCDEAAGGAGVCGA